jgi:hypothetical protein
VLRGRGGAGDGPAWHLATDSELESEPEPPPPWFSGARAGAYKGFRI